MDLQSMRGLHTLLTTLQRHGANALVTLGKAALNKGDCQFMLPCRRLKADLLQPSIDFFDRRIQRLVYRFMVGFAANIGAVKLLAVQESEDSVFKFHSRHF